MRNKTFNPFNIVVCIGIFVTFTKLQLANLTIYSKWFLVVIIFIALGILMIFKIKFTFEEENDNKILFLNISITRTGNNFTTSISHKKMFSRVYLNFHSHLPTDYKKGVINTLLKNLKKLLLKNSVTLFFIDKCVKTFLDKLFIKRQKIKDSSTKKEITISLEFLGNISLQVKRQLIEIFRICNKDIKLNVVLKSSVRMSNASRFKDQIPICLNSMLLYKFTCNTYDSVYIGKTKRHYLVASLSIQNYHSSPTKP